MEGRYGSMFLDRWRNCDMANVRATWAEELAGFRDKPEAIGAAIAALGDSQYPPTLPEFLAACREAAKRLGNANTTPMLDIKANPERAAAVIAEAVKATKRPAFDDLAWARNPASPIALQAVRDLAKTDDRFAAILAEFNAIAQGVRA